MYKAGFWAWYFRDVAPVSGQTLTFVFTPEAGGSPVSQAAVIDGASWLVEDDGGPTIATLGWYSWAALLGVTGATAKTVVASGRVDIRPDPATSTADTRSEARTILDAIEDVLAGNLADGVSSVTVRGRTLSMIPTGELLELHRHYSAIVQYEETGRYGSRARVAFRE